MGSIHKLFHNVVFLGFGPIADFISKAVSDISPRTNQHVLTNRPIRSSLIGKTNIEISNNLDELPEFDSASVTCVIISWKTMSDFQKSNFDFFSKKFFSCNDNLLINLSSASVYGSNILPVSETSHLNPINIYGQEKLKIEKYLQTLYSDRLVNLRISNVLSPAMGQSLAWLIAKSALSQNSILIPPPKLIVRDYINIELVGAIILEILNYSPGKFEPGNYNISSGNSITLESYIQSTEIILGSKVNFEMRELNQGEIMESRLDNKKIRKSLRKDVIFFNNQVESFLNKIKISEIPD